MHQTVTSGIPTLWDEGPGPLTGALVFGVGTRDETFRLNQVSHVVEHLAMSTLPKGHLDHNAFVTLDSTVFHATGRPEAVADFLQRICRALSNLPVHDLVREAGVIDAEQGAPAHPALCWTLNHRYGNSGPGLALLQGPDIDQIPVAAVQEHARTFFTRDNVVAVFTGEPPAALELDLPQGRRPARVAAVPQSLTLPAMIRDEMEWPVLSFTVPVVDGSWVVPAILSDRILDELRHRQGISYSLDGDQASVDGQRVVAFMPDGRQDRQVEVTESVWAALRTLADEGPTEAEIAHHIEGFVASLTDPRALVDVLTTEAVALLEGHTPRSTEHLIAAVQDLTPAVVQAWARSAHDTALLGVPSEVQVELAGVTDLTDVELPSGPAVLGETFKRKPLCLAPFDLRVGVGDAGLSLTAGGYTWSGTWDDVVGVARADGDRGVVFKDGRSVQMCDKHLRDTERLFRIIDERAGAKVFDVPKDAFH